MSKLTPQMEFYCCSIFSSEIKTDEDKQLVKEALAGCNKVAEEDFGPDHTLDTCPELLVLARNVESEVVGFLCFYFHERNFAWEIGTCSARMPYRHSIIMRKVLDYLPRELTLYYKRQPHLTRKAYLVRRLKSSQTRAIQYMLSVGFHKPQWLEAILSDDGYVPFDPIDELLVKKKVFPNVFTNIEKLEADINKSSNSTANENPTKSSTAPRMQPGKQPR